MEQFSSKLEPGGLGSLVGAGALSQHPRFSQGRLRTATIFLVLFSGRRETGAAEEDGSSSSASSDLAGELFTEYLTGVPWINWFGFQRGCGPKMME